MQNRITLSEALQLENALFIDVRSPQEFAEGKIYGAVNVPLLNNEERALVGTIYRNEGGEKARDKGFAAIAPKLPDLVKQIKAFSRQSNHLIIYCWRGGMRSKSVTDLLRIVGVEAKQLEGGYKKYRNYVLDTLQNFPLKPKIIMLCGSTGTGKTKILQLLAQKNLPVIDLEELAHHRGSVFGHVGIKDVPQAKEFDTQLLHLLTEFNDRPYIIVECESKRIGSVYLPDVLYQAMQNGKKILLTAPMEVRILRLMEEYLDVYQQNKLEIIEKAEHLRPRLGNKKTNNLLNLLKQDNIKEAVKILLTDYYDPLYGYETGNKFEFAKCIEADDLEKAAKMIADYLDEEDSAV
ncbi:MAG: tRNA 2-selenouridine(34) synthase MnmH [Sporomusaceae bacterium]|jgi:tRNA 2-selenouridine synthase|nr:tRNA 2-selenouridine(34) synthase MnmH [Sporomusaceae bacterium]